MIFGSCSKSAAPTASLKTDIDTISYELGMINSAGVKQYLSERLGVDTTYMDEFYKGLVEAANSSDNKKKAAYFAGIQIGQQLGTQMFKGINYQLFGEDSTKSISMRNLLSGFIAQTEGKAEFDIEKVRNGLQEKMGRFRDKSLAKTYAANKEAGEKFMAQNKTKEGIKELTPGGVQYKVIKEGNGPIPADTSRVMVSYEGRTIDGKVFDSSYKNNDNKPIEITVNNMIPGWIDVLTHMPVGSVWEIYIPQEKAYGSREAGEDVKPFSALIFKLELVSISPNK
jgi:FKBP-type peptidyl-prolyl cis-trans isomerase FklB